MTDNLQMGVRTRRLARAVLGCAAICAAASARADDYVLAAGETDALAFAGGTVTNFTSMTVAGSLGITGDGWIKTPTLNLDGGTLTVDGAKASIGTAHYRDQTPTTVTFTNAADGTYGKVIVKNGTAAAQNDYRYNFGAKYFNGLFLTGGKDKWLKSDFAEWVQRRHLITVSWLQIPAARETENSSKRSEPMIPQLRAASSQSIWIV